MSLCLPNRPARHTAISIDRSLRMFCPTGRGEGKGQREREREREIGGGGGDMSIRAIYMINEFLELVTQPVIKSSRARHHV